ncbi:MAG: hypothetical protein AABZ63_07015, partial [Actinomycetota bacterium]
MIASLKDLLQPARTVSHRQVSTRLVNPVGLMRRLGLPGSGPFVLLDSAGGNPDLCRYSFLAWNPRLAVTVRRGITRITGPGAAGADGFLGGGAFEVEAEDPFELIRKLLGALSPDEAIIPQSAANLPISGGVFGLAGYDAGRY